MNYENMYLDIRLEDLEDKTLTIGDIIKFNNLLNVNIFESLVKHFDNDVHKVIDIMLNEKYRYYGEELDEIAIYYLYDKFGYEFREYVCYVNAYQLAYKLIANGTLVKCNDGNGYIMLL